MYLINDDLSIYATRGDVVSFFVEADDDGQPYIFNAGDVVRIKVFGKKACDNVVLQKDFSVTESGTQVNIFLDEEDTKIGNIINKPVDYWYEVELNPLTMPQTIIAYDDDGPKVFRLFPEGKDFEVYNPTEEDIPYVDDRFDPTSVNPVQNQLVTAALLRLENLISEVKNTLSERIDNELVSRSLTDTEMDKRVKELEENAVCSEVLSTA